MTEGLVLNSSLKTYCYRRGIINEIHISNEVKKAVKQYEENKTYFYPSTCKYKYKQKCFAQYISYWILFI